LLPLLLATGSPDTVRGQYVEARTCDVFVGSCFANADTGLIGKTGVLAGKIEAGAVDGGQVNGLGGAPAVGGPDRPRVKQTGGGQAVIIVDEKATTAQRAALVKFVQTQAGKLVEDIVAVRPSAFDLTICNCDGEGCATLKAGAVKVATRCIDVNHDKACAN